MASNSPSDPIPPRSGGWLDRLKAMAASLAPSDPPPPPAAKAPAEILPNPTREMPALTTSTAIPVATPVEQMAAAAPVSDEIPFALLVEQPADQAAAATPSVVSAERGTLQGDVVLNPERAATDPAEEAEAPAKNALSKSAAPSLPVETVSHPTAVLEHAAPPVVLCPVCQSPQPGGQESCSDCGYHFGSIDPPPLARVLDRYELRAKTGEREGIERFRGLDHGDGTGSPRGVVIVREALGPEPSGVAARESSSLTEEAADEFMPGFDAVESGSIATDILPPRPAWPSIAWEQSLLRTLEQPLLPAVLDCAVHDGFQYLVVEVPTGRPFWDAWDDAETSNEQRYTWLIQLAEGLASLHHCNAILEAIRPDLVVIADSGHVRLCDVADLLPLPVPAGVPVRGTLYTAPELMSATGAADARAGLYSFGAMLYALHVGRELQEIDFDRPGYPKPFIPRFPDVHPAFGRLIAKTFCREPAGRFPTDEALREDANGFVELIRTLDVLKRTLDVVRMEIASWTTTGMVRTGNEDGYALLHACESRQDDAGEQVLILLADGMGGYEAGEVAAAVTLQVLREYLLGQKAFAALAGHSPFTADPLAPAGRPDSNGPESIDVETCKQHIKTALKEANRQVFQLSRTPGSKRRGMGCTAEVVFLDGRHVVVGHVGDSRTYHLHDGRLVQLTRDQTLVNRLVELGSLTPEEAENHPRRNELQQAIGGQPDVEPGLYHGRLSPQDWVLVCSDGLTNHVSALALKEMLLSEAQSAEMAARRLINLANIEGATDNVTVVAVRCT